ncbi:3-phenylpropionate/trans-cinnamate dioxygenase ferredoxin reductase subunit [Arthrobacter sp. 1088]|uniref:NAD(P)/FAD-dependent oxidoreductase n=1 Tax=Arthrobacter sp. 1088 TaxID=2817768 RepID=UPI002858EA81|nr:FAD-dependent oxidoreductase [Arthrobacter sp. 1088]MDR6688765.1 3-phenylpropionate/trans-cinnamate dioxygenase ferredoxin reductase subunit [Arthrobacter sp. 1088]
MTQASADRHVVIVGASLAGTRAAEGLRHLGHAGRITLIGAEPELPYDRPPLSKELLTSDWSDESVESFRLATKTGLEGAGIELKLGVAATGLDTTNRRVILADGTTVVYDVVIIATGAAARPSPWRPGTGVYQLRTLEDSRAIAARLRLGEPVVVVGGGFIGTEIAAAAVGYGCDVTVVDPVSEPMARIVGPEIARSLVELHHRHGAQTRFGVGVADIQGQDGQLTVILDDGTRLETSTAVVGIGSIASTEWLAASGLTLDNGVMTDGFLRATGADDVYAIGDVARWPHPGRGMQVRAEHWTNASDQARYVAAAITQGVEEPYDSTDYVWSHQYDWKVHTIGWRHPEGSSTIVGDLAESGKTAVIHSDAKGDVCGAVTVNWVRGLNLARRLFATGESAETIVEKLGQLA